MTIHDDGTPVLRDGPVDDGVEDAMSDDERLPRIGDREGLRIELAREAVSTYRQSRETETGVSLDDVDAERELLAVVRDSYVTYGAGERMRTRARIRRLGVDVETDATRVSPDHIRVFFARVRYYDGDHGSKHGPGVLRLRAPTGENIGFLRADTRGVIEYRERESNVWGRPPPNLREIAREQASRGYPAMERWLAERGIRSDDASEKPA